MKKVEQESDLKATYITTIESEGGKIDINDLGSDIESLRKATQAQILQIFAREIENNETFNDKYRNFNFSELVNNIIDWVDENKESLNGGDERSYYQDFLEDHPSEMIPPNRPLKTLKELHMIAGMNDDFYRLLESKVTTFGIKGINVNYANAEIFKALDPLINDEIAQKIIERRNDPNEGLFKNEDDFVGFLGTLINTNQFNEAQIPLLFDTVYNFRIRSTGEFAKASREITVVTFDFDNLTGRMAELLDKQDESSGEGKKPDDDPAKPPPKTPDPNAKPSPPAKKVNPKGRPRIVYWQET